MPPSDKRKPEERLKSGHMEKYVSKHRYASIWTGSRMTLPWSTSAMCKLEKICGDLERRRFVTSWCSMIYKIHVSLLCIYKGRVATRLFCIGLYIKKLQNACVPGLHKNQEYQGFHHPECWCHPYFRPISRTECSNCPSRPGFLVIFRMRSGA